MAGSDFTAFLALIGRVALWLVRRTLELVALALLLVAGLLPWRLLELLLLTTFRCNDQDQDQDGDQDWKTHAVVRCCLTHSLTHSLIGSLAHWLIGSLTHSLIDSLTH
jgi:hypothetical protein